MSLAAALALPFTIPGGESFPYRDLILFVSFGVIFITLVGLGLGLPPVVRWLGVAQAGREEHRVELDAEIAARREALGVALQSLDAITDETRRRIERDLDLEEASLANRENREAPL